MRYSSVVWQEDHVVVIISWFEWSKLHYGGVRQEARREAAIKAGL